MDTINRDPLELVFPGTKIGVIEEFYPGSGTYTDNDFIYSAVLGTVVTDLEKHEISVLARPKTAVIPKNGDVALGGIVNVSKQMITVAVNYINNVEVYPTYTCIIHVSQVSRDYLENADDAVCVGDIVRCKFIDTKTIPLQGTMIGSQFGVILAYCSKCGHRLEKKGRNKLNCPECSNIERRKTAIDYGRGYLSLKVR